ncbi:MAG: F0F1 ATP synthase subunit epsilon [Armatimonadia bacterium]|nr:F0F1 ATP synthase subunit epsilon [Armatimonadia bacterium]
MNLRVLLPTGVLLEVEVAKVKAEALDGAFGMLPRHVDFVAPLRAGIVEYEETGGDVGFVAVDRGLLVKRGPDVTVSTTTAVLGDDLAPLRERMAEHLESQREEERKARTALADLELRLMDFFIGDGGRG